MRTYGALSRIEDGWILGGLSLFVDVVVSSGVSYEDLIADLLRYGGNNTSEAEWRRKYPIISDELIVAAASTADECPVCLMRFIYLGPSAHREGCQLAEVLSSTS